MLDIILVAVPFTIITVPPMGISVLKGAVQSQGFKAQTVDLGMELFKACNRSEEYFQSLQEYFILPNLADDPDTKHNVEEFIEIWSQKLANSNARYIGISVFSFYSHLASYLLAKRIKEINPAKKIVIGGPGSNIKISEDMIVHYRITGIEQTMSFGQILKRRGFIDECVIGDGEQALIDILKSDQLPEATEFKIVDYKNYELPFADFDDFILTDYAGQLKKGYPSLPIFSSKGCVRNCDFCDVNVVQNGFRFRSGKNILKEMIHLSNRHGIQEFLFNDSLVNGSMKSLNELVTDLSTYNLQNPDKKITWSGNWICRPIGQIKPEFYPQLAAAGADALSIGAESGSNHVLTAMNKKSSVEALHYEAEQFSKNGIKFLTLLITAHWSEHWEDFLQTCDMLYKLAKYARMGIYTAADVGMSYNIIDDTPSALNTQKNLLTWTKRFIWWTATNPSLTAKERYFRVLLLRKLCDRMKIPHMYKDGLAAIYKNLKFHLDEIQEFYQEKIKSVDQLPRQHAGYYYRHFDEFIDLVSQRNAETNNQFDVYIELEVSSPTNNLPIFEIYCNDQLVYKQGLDSGIHKIDLQRLQLSPHSLQSLTMKFSNKLVGDTIVDSQGNIVEDKFIILKKFVVNDIDLIVDQEFFYNYLKYTEESVPTEVRQGFWFNNSALTLEFDKPFILWYCDKSNYYSQLSADISSQSNIAPGEICYNDQDYSEQIAKILETLEY